MLIEEMVAVDFKKPMVFSILLRGPMAFISTWEDGKLVLGLVPLDGIVLFALGPPSTCTFLGF